MIQNIALLTIINLTILNNCVFIILKQSKLNNMLHP